MQQIPQPMEGRGRIRRPFLMLSVWADGPLCVPDCRERSEGVADPRRILPWMRKGSITLGCGALGRPKGSTRPSRVRNPMGARAGGRDLSPRSAPWARAERRRVCPGEHACSPKWRRHRACWSMASRWMGFGHPPVKGNRERQRERGGDRAVIDMPSRWDMTHMSDDDGDAPETGVAWDGREARDPGTAHARSLGRQWCCRLTRIFARARNARGHRFDSRVGG